MKHQVRQYGDEYHCSCGLTWHVDDDDPHDNKRSGRETLKELKEMFDESPGSLRVQR